MSKKNSIRQHWASFADIFERSSISRAASEEKKTWKDKGEFARSTRRRGSAGIFGRNGTGRRWMGSPMVGVALWVGVAGSIQGGFVDGKHHGGVNEYSVYPSAPLSAITLSRARLLPAN